MKTDVTNEARSLLNSGESRETKANGALLVSVCTLRPKSKSVSHSVVSNSL